MAARRLLIVMLVLLGVATVTAALVGNRPISGERTESTTTGETETTKQAASVPAETQPQTDGRQLKPLTIELGRKVIVVPINVGDQLALTVCAKEPDQLEIPGLGLLEPVEPEAPAFFDILAREPESYGISLVSTGRVAARIEVTKPPKKGPEDPEPEAQKGSSTAPGECASTAAKPEPKPER